jgi:nickel-dependent lactate racemase
MKGGQSGIEMIFGLASYGAHYKRDMNEKMISAQEAAAILDDAFSQWDVEGKRVLVVIPDRTRTCPMDVMFRLIYKRAAEQSKELNFLVALGTHQPMSRKEIYEHVGIDETQHQKEFPKARFLNHQWKEPDQLVEVGRFSKEEISELSGGLFSMEVSITCNRLVTEADLVIIVGPVFPHEVVGFSGGNKYLFPGVAGQEIIDFHWLGAVITSPAVIGKKMTPVRRVVDRREVHV